ncbi:uroporphyrinogen decarboxylase family protein [Thermodesulfobacteriota bacterium]
MEKTPKELYKERLKRVEDAIQLKVPDRVPIVPIGDYFPSKYCGVSVEAAFYDPAQWRQAVKKTMVDFEPDLYRASRGFPGRVYEILGCTQARWPGQPGISGTHQFVEGEYMKADEYDAFLYDPSDYAVRSYLPRVFSAMEPLKNLLPLNSITLGYMEAMMADIFIKPEFTDLFETLAEAGREAQAWKAEWDGFTEEMEALGFPEFAGSMSQAPFDIISDYHRGMRGTMLDLYRRPDELMEACEKLVPVLVERGVFFSEKSGNPRVFIPLHRGSEGFMSLEHFETFYWPTLKKVIVALVDKGLTPCPFFEGDFTSRLEYILELPKGKILANFDATDLFKAKEVIGKHTCIRGNVPVSLLSAGTPRDVEDYCKKLIDIVGKDGGFAMCSGGAVEEGKVENVKAMFDFTKEYGIYR